MAFITVYIASDNACDCSAGISCSAATLRATSFCASNKLFMAWQIFAGPHVLDGLAQLASVSGLYFNEGDLRHDQP